LPEAKRLVRSGRAPRGFYFDFDGVLAPIQEDPESSKVDPEMLTALRRLGRVVDRVAVVSARPVSFLASRLGDIPNVGLFGLYGLETLGRAGNVVTDPAAERWVPVVHALNDRAKAELPPQALVEYKRLSLALHYRRAPELQTVVDEWADAVAGETGLRPQRGRMVVELMPPVGRNKGTVITEETASLASAWYFGDDVSDLAGFEALSRRAKNHPGFTGVRVAVSNPETGAALREAADFVLESTKELLDLLAVLTEELEG
jgi:trehalose 6-phosphate phosphatase